jgi:hypothetical protein
MEKLIQSLEDSGVGEVARSVSWPVRCPITLEGLRGKLSDYDALVSNPQAICYIAEFMHQTGLLGQFRHADMMELAEQDQEQGSLL